MNQAVKKEASPLAKFLVRMVDERVSWETLSLFLNHLYRKYGGELPRNINPEAEWASFCQAL